MNRYIRQAVTAVVTIAAVAAAAVSQAQIRIVDRAVIDSLANPQLADGSDAMRFERTAIDTGTIGENDEPPVYEYRYRNEGAEPIAVVRVTTSCGCTVARAVPAVVPAGGEGVIRVTYKPRGHIGRHMRRVFVYTQLSERRPTAVLTLETCVAAGNSDDNR